MIDGFLRGIIVTCSVIAGGYFMKFWRQTRDTLFLAFGIAFIVEAANRTTFVFMDSPNTGNTFVYIVRLLTYVLILTTIVKKNRE